MQGITLPTLALLQVLAVDAFPHMARRMAADVAKRESNYLGRTAEADTTKGKPCRPSCHFQNSRAPQPMLCSTNSTLLRNSFRSPVTMPSSHQDRTTSVDHAQDLTPRRTMPIYHGMVSRRMKQFRLDCGRHSGSIRLRLKSFSRQRLSSYVKPD